MMSTFVSGSKLMGSLLLMLTFLFSFPSCSTLSADELGEPRAAFSAVIDGVAPSRRHHMCTEVE